ncbi:DUF2970 domain-containing protein [Candidatus Methylocalor cossyra]|uniref:DUF2970 domain-containing protein n=1 Tax=Candidatus Methylocalor cossyra TaxID=3108543 RepID=A0ABM9NG58_9GAMM
MPEPQRSKPTLAQVIASVLAAAFGVQSTANRERDFRSGSATAYIVVGVIFTVLFVVVLMLVVHWAIRAAGS